LLVWGGNQTVVARPELTLGVDILSDWRTWLGLVLFLAAIILMFYFSEKD